MARKASKASNTTPRTTDKATATPDAVNPKVAAALGYAPTDTLAQVQSRADVAAGALAHRAYAERTLTSATVKAIAEALGVSDGQANAAIRAGRFIDRCGPTYATKVAKAALACGRENAKTIKHLNGLKGKALADAIIALDLKIKSERNARNAETAARREAGKSATNDASKGSTDAPTKPTTPATFSDRLKAVEAILAATATKVPRKPTAAQRTSFAAIAALVVDIAAQMGTTVEGAAAFGVSEKVEEPAA